MAKPHHDARGELLRLSIRGAREDLGPTPEIRFSSELSALDLEVVPGSLVHVEGGGYDFLAVSTGHEVVRSCKVILSGERGSDADAVASVVPEGGHEPVHAMPTDQPPFDPVPSDRPIPTPHVMQEASRDDGDADCVCACGCTVLLHSGEERFDRTDLLIPGRGHVHFSLKRRYRSRLDYNGPLGFGWDFDYNESLFPQPNGDVIRLNGRGHVDRWIRNRNNSFTAPKGHFRSLRTAPGGGLVLREPDGFKRFYRADGRLERYEDRFGNVMLFEYDARGNLGLVVDAFGRSIEFVFGTTAGGRDRLTVVRDFTGREVGYDYDRHGDLVEARTPVVIGTSTGNDFPAGRAERYAYLSGHAEPQLNHKLVAATLPEEAAAGGPPALSWTYGTDSHDPMTFAKVISETVGGINASGRSAGGTTSFKYQLLNTSVPLGRPDVHRAVVTITNPIGNQTMFFGNERCEHVLTLEMPRRGRHGRRSATRSFYNVEGLKERTILPEGNELRWRYDTAGARGQQANVIEVRRIADAVRAGGDDLVSTMTYEPLYNQIASVTDPRGHATAFRPPIGSVSAARYTTKFLYDYQEGVDPIPDVVAFGLDIGGVPRGLGDLNDDGDVGRSAGNLVRIEGPHVELRPGSREAARLGSTVQPNVRQYQWNERGQIAAIIDEEGNVVRYGYHPEDDPAGDGHVTTAGSVPLTSGPFGYVSDITVDAEQSPRRTGAVAPAKLRTEYRYNAAGNLVGLLNPRGILTRFEVNALNEVISVVRGADVGAAIAAGQLLTGEQALSYQTRFFYDANSRVHRVLVDNRDGSAPGIGPSIEFGSVYDILGDEIEVFVQAAAAARLVTRCTYDANRMAMRIVQPLGNAIEIAYDDRDLPHRLTRGAGSAEASTNQSDYDLNGSVQRQQDAEDKDGDGRPEAREFVYDGFDRPVAVVDSLGNTIKYTYDPASNVIALEVIGHPAGRPQDPPRPLFSATYNHDERNRAFRTDRALFLAGGFTVTRPVDLRDGDRDGLVTTFSEFDALSRVTGTAMDDGEMASAEYDGAGRLIHVRDAVGNTQSRTYDQNSNVTRITSLEVSPEGLVAPEAYTTWYVYDQLDRNVRVTDNAGQTEYFEYDARDNLVTRCDAEGELIADPLGLVAAPARINRPGNARRYTYDGAGRLIREVRELRVNGAGHLPLDLSNVHNPAGQIVTRYEYDANSRLIGLTDHAGHRTTFEFDALNRKVGHVFADGRRYSFAYDADDNLRRIVDPNGTIIDRSYDALSRLVRASITRAPGVAGTTTEVYEYDGLSRLTRSIDDNGDALRQQQIERVYDSLSRLLEERQNGQTISNVFEGHGARVAITYPGGRAITRTHDGINRIKTTADAAGVISESFYFGSGLRELKRVNRNGTSVSLLNDTATAIDGYDAVRRLVRNRVFSGAAAFLDRSYRYTRTNQRAAAVRADDAGLSDTFSYDSSYRLTESRFDRNGPSGALTRPLARVEYAYDGVGNRRTVTEDLAAGASRTAYAVDDVNAYAAVGGTARAHDANGNVIDDGRHRYVYDYRNRIVAAFDSQGGQPVSQYFYDTNSRRTRRVLWRAADAQSDGQDTLFFYDGHRLCEEQTPAGVTTLTAVHAPVYIDELLQIERTGAHPLGAAVIYPHHDARADVIAVTDATGSVIEKRFFDDFGRAYDGNKQPALRTASGIAFGFQGQRLDAETGLYYFRARHYDPAAGRFLQRDPSWDSENAGNQYTFVGNNPATLVDPFGLGPHELTVEVVDGGTSIIKTFTSGGTDAETLARIHELIGEGAFGKYELQNYSHTERKALRWLLELRGEGKLSANAQIFMTGNLKPCGGRGCRSAMARWVHIMKRPIQYQWLENGVWRTWRPGLWTRFTSGITFPGKTLRLPIPKLPMIPKVRLPAGVKVPLLTIGATLLFGAAFADAAEEEAIASGASKEEADLVGKTVFASSILPEATQAALNPESGLSVPGLVVADIGTNIGVDGPGDFADYWTGRISFSEWMARRHDPKIAAQKMLDTLSGLYDFFTRPSTPAAAPAPVPKCPTGPIGDIAPITGSTYTGR